MTKVKCISRRRLRSLCTAAFVCIACLPTLTQSAEVFRLPSPGQIADVVCAADPSQSYALLLPSAYSPTKRWPIIYFFDPGGRGQRPIDLYKDLADKYGFIFAGSNNSRNFSSDQSKSVNAIWLDTHQRLSLDEHRIYSSGFSGGARVAGAMAMGCPTCQIAGVMAHGAGYPTNQPPARGKLLYFFAVGDRDFNWPEVMKVRNEREDRGLPYRVRVYSGKHQWAPPDVMDEALQWMALKSMQSGDLAPDPAFIERVLQSTRAEADQAGRNRNALAQLAAYRTLVSDFAGLKDAAELAKSLSALKQSADLKAALKAEREQIDEQYSIERDISPKLRMYAEGSAVDPNVLRTEIVQAMGGLRSQAEHAKQESKRLVYSRALEDMWIEGIENGQQELEARRYDKAEACFELMTEVRKDPWIFVLLAEAQASTGNKKQAIRSLQQAVRLGLTDPTALESDTKLESLKDDSEFQKLVAGLKQGSKP